MSTNGNGQFREDELVTRKMKVKGEWQTRTFPVVGGRLRIAHEGNEQLSIQTEIVKLETDLTVAKATVETEKGRYSGTGTVSAQRDARLSDSLVELAETRAIARALRFGGFGVEYCGAEEVNHVPDEGEPKQADNEAGGPVFGNGNGNGKQRSKPQHCVNGRATQAQCRALYALTKKAEYGNEDIDRTLSQINTYMSCPLRYELQYVEQIPPAFKSAALTFGSAIHEAVGAFYDQHLIGDSLRVDQMLDVYKEAWRNWDESEIRFFNGDDADSLQDKAERMLAAFQESFDPSIVVVGVEEFFEIELGDMPPLQGYIDLIEQSEGGQITVADLKTAARKPTNGSVHQNVQRTAYSVGVVALGFAPDDVNLRLDVLTKTKNPELVRLATTRTDQDRDRFKKLAQHVWNAIEREAFFPKQDWTCKQCAWADPCAIW